MTTTVYDSRRLVAVPIPGTQIMYGFQTNVKDTISTQCGHVAGVGAGDQNGFINNLVIGANSPKPPRGSKVGGSSTFVDSTKIAALKGDGWNVRPGRYTAVGKSAKSSIVFVEVGFIKYGWHLPKFLLDQSNFSSAMAALGITLATNNDRDIVMGASYPKPPRARFSILVGDEINSFSSYVAPLKIDSLPDGWSLVHPGFYPSASALP